MSNGESFAAFTAAAGNHLTATLAGGALEESLAALFDYVGRGCYILFHNRSPLLFI